ncbi:50S ribosomal protein L5 [Candidatus Woesearchaeota archaeon]|jgi:large subunit ribosomal protein L5|nr:50S ribosomal protein L5 [Candidatus Woesearchaeota archaeon]
MNVNKQIQIEKITLNFGAGKDQSMLEKGMKLIEYITGIKPIKTKATKRIPGWGLRPGLPIGCKLTIRDKTKADYVKRFLKAKADILKQSNFDQHGNIAFGVHEYIDIDGVEYNPDLGLIGLQICITLKRNGYRIKKRKIMKRSIPKTHQITQEESIEFMKKEFNVKVEEK